MKAAWLRLVCPYWPLLRALGARHRPISLAVGCTGGEGFVLEEGEGGLHPMMCFQCCQSACVCVSHHAVRGWTGEIIAGLRAELELALASDLDG